MPEANHCVPTAPAHPLASVILDAAKGRFPQSDGGWRRLPTWRPGLEAVVAFTGHALVCVDEDVEDATLDALGVDGLGGAHAPGVLSTLAGPDGWTSSLDVVLVRTPGATSVTGTDVGTGDPAAAWPQGAQAPLVVRPDLADQPRVAYAARLRDDLKVFGYTDPGRSAVAIVGHGLAGLPELSYELEPERRGRGEGSAFVGAAVRSVGVPGTLVACVAPGNAASLRVLLACGFTPVGSVQLVRRPPGYQRRRHRSLRAVSPP